jgi:hypothetical protein
VISRVPETGGVRPGGHAGGGGATTTADGADDATGGATLTTSRALATVEVAGNGGGATDLPCPHPSGAAANDDAETSQRAATKAGRMASRWCAICTSPASP